MDYQMARRGGYPVQHRGGFCSSAARDTGYGCSYASCGMGSGSANDMNGLGGGTNGSGMGGGTNSTCNIKNNCYPALSMVYSPLQAFENIYDYQTGLSQGTIFKALDKPLSVMWRNKR